MRKLLTVIGIVLLAIGVFKANALISFLSNAVPLTATVTTVELRTGPPKPTQNTPVHIRFTLPSGEERAGITNLPLLQVVKEGDLLPILVDPANPQVVRLPLLSELWATPLAYLLSGLAIVCGVLFIRVKRGEFGATQLQNARSS